MFAIVPVKMLESSKQRLSYILTSGERARLSEAMLIDVLGALCNSIVSKVMVVSNDIRVMKIAEDFGALIVKEEEQLGVNSAIALTNNLCKGCDACIVIPHDLPFVLPSDIDMICTSAMDKRSIVITPSQRFDGTNALLRRPSDVIETHYDEDSYKLHLNKAREKHISVKIILNKRLMVDIDEPGDVTQIMESNQVTKTKSYLLEIRYNPKP